MPKGWAIRNIGAYGLYNLEIWIFQLFSNGEIIEFWNNGPVCAL